MPKVYIAAAFRRFSNRDETKKAYGELTNNKYIDFLEKIEEVFLDFGFETCLPHRDEGMWGKAYYEPAAISSLCLRHVRTSDVIFALAESGRGVHIELGYAAGIDTTKIIMMYKKGTEPSTLIFGLSGNQSPWKVDDSEGMDNAIIVPYSDETDLLIKLEKILSSQYTKKNDFSRTARTKVAIMDIGSHTVKLKVLSHRPGGHPRTLHEAKRSLGIIGDVIKTGDFSEETINNVVSLLKAWKTECIERSCKTFIVTGTAALRRAGNAAGLVSRLFKETSLELEILSPEKELEYVFSGVLSTFKTGNTIAVLNLGGGSTQLGIGSDSSLDEQFFFDFGTRELTEKWPWNKPMTKIDYDAMLHHVRKRIRQIIPAKIRKVDRIVHTGGELDFMLRCQLPLQVSFLSPIHVSEILTNTFSLFSQEFSRSDPNRIAKDFGLDPAWASGAVASNVIALCLAEMVEAEAIIPSNFNISDGLLLQVSEAQR